jgi:membrane protein DedA with SNARE-associated domain
MALMHIALLNQFLLGLHNLGPLAYFIVAFVSLLEATAFVGSIVPGGLVVIFSGFLAARGDMSFLWLFLLVTLAAIIGDAISYEVGTKGTHFFKDENKWLKMSHFDQGKEYFNKYGDKTVFFGRLVGPVRAVVPFIAGLIRMDRKTFFMWNVLGAIFWAGSHLLLGYFFGNVFFAIEHWYERIGVALFVLSVCGIVWYLWRKRTNLKTI